MSVGPLIWVEGLIGSGKTTMVEKLSKQLGVKPLYEPVAANPFLDRFYQNPKRWAFPMQMWLLNRRFTMQQIASAEAALGPGAILDRGLPGDRVFARLHMVAGNMDPLEWETYEQHFETWISLLRRTPGLLVYLDVDPLVALERVKRRSRNAEATISVEYLSQLREGYDDLLEEVTSGRHAWSQGIKVHRVEWNQDNQETEPIAAMIRDYFRLPAPGLLSSAS